MVFANAMCAMLMLSPPSGAVGPEPLELDRPTPVDEELEHDVQEDEVSDDAVEPEWSPEPPPVYGPAMPPGEEVEVRTKKWDSSPFFSMGLAPMSTLHAEGFHPGIRYDLATGLTWQRGRARIWVGPELHISKYYGRKKPSVGLDAMMTLSFKHVYGRVGAGTVAWVPARADLHDTRPMMGGLAGAGLVGRLDHIEGSIGVDYDIRMDTTGRVAQTVLISMRLAFGP